MDLNLFFFFGYHYFFFILNTVAPVVFIESSWRGNGAERGRPAAKEPQTTGPDPGLTAQETSPCTSMMKVERWK